jgi:HlyD family secretion protein
MNAPQTTPATATATDFLKTPPSSSRWRRIMPWLLGLLLILAGLAGWQYSSHQAGQGRYLTEPLALGNLTVTISASGTLQPTRSVDVGSELSGTLVEVLVDDNDRVSKGQVLARLDTSRLADAVSKSRAAVAAAEATVVQATVTLSEASTQLKRQQKVAELSGGKLPAKSELDAALATQQRAQASLVSAQAAVLQARAVLKSDETNIGKAVIRSPINGVVLTRRVEPGQTVAASMTTPVMFTIAEDLTRMKLAIKVDEADIGSVKLGQPASFNVAAWAGRRFPATIQRVGLGSAIVENVVTYTTLLSVANDDLALRPGMTASARIVTAQRDNVLLVPNAALRFTPPAEKAAPGLVASLLPRPPARNQPKTKRQKGGEQQLWLLKDGQPVAVPVQVGASDGRHTEITGGEVRAGQAIIIDYQGKPK